MKNLDILKLFLILFLVLYTSIINASFANSTTKQPTANHNNDLNDISTEFIKELTNSPDNNFTAKQIKSELKSSNSSNLYLGSAMQQLIKTPAENSVVFYPATCSAKSFITLTILDSQSNRQPYVGLKINESNLQADYRGQVVYYIPETTTNSLSIVLLNTKITLNTKIIPGKDYSNSVEHASPIINNVIVTQKLFSVINIDGDNFEGIADHNVVYIDDVIPAKILASSSSQLQVKMPLTLQSGIHVVHVVTDGSKSNRVVFKI